MLLPVQILIRTAVPESSYYEFVVEDAIPVKHLFGAKFLFCNKSATVCKLRVGYTVAQSGVFSDSFTPVSDEPIALNGTYTYEFGGPLIQDSLITHTIRYINDDTSARTLYGILSGYTDVKQVLSTYIGTQPA